MFAHVTEGLIFVPSDQDAPALHSEVCLNTFGSSIIVTIPCLLDLLPLPKWLCKWKQVCWSQSRATPAAPHLYDQQIHWYLALLLLPLCQIVAFCTSQFILWAVLLTSYYQLMPLSNPPVSCFPCSTVCSGSNPSIEPLTLSAPPPCHGSTLFLVSSPSLSQAS